MHVLEEAELLTIILVGTAQCAAPSSNRHACQMSVTVRLLASLGLPAMALSHGPALDCMRQNVSGATRTFTIIEAEMANVFLAVCGVVSRRSDSHRARCGRARCTESFFRKQPATARQLLWAVLVQEGGGFHRSACPAGSASTSARIARYESKMLLCMCGEYAQKVVSTRTSPTTSTCTSSQRGTAPLRGPRLLLLPEASAYSLCGSSPTLLDYP